MTTLLQAVLTTIRHDRKGLEDMDRVSFECGMLLRVWRAHRGNCFTKPASFAVLHPETLSLLANFRHFGAHSSVEG